jgi:hypothetical protein
LKAQGKCLQVDNAKWLKAFEVENAKLKRLLAESILANDAIREFLEKKDNRDGATRLLLCVNSDIWL